MHKHTGKPPLGTKELLSGYKFCRKRIDLLWRKGLRIEAVLYMSVLVEFGVKEAISNFEKIIEAAAFDVEVGFNPRNLYSKKDIDSQPLGYLVRVLETYTRDKKLIADLRKFGETRNRCVHKILGSKPEEIKRDLKDFDIFFLELMIRVLQLNIQQMQHAEKNFKIACDECFKKMVETQVKM